MGSNYRDYPYANLSFIIPWSVFHWILDILIFVTLLFRKFSVSLLSNPIDFAYRLESEIVNFSATTTRSLTVAFLRDNNGTR